MKKFKLLLVSAFLALGVMSSLESFACFPEHASTEKALVKPTNDESTSISFKLRGNGVGLVEIGVGPRVGTGACCRGVSKDSTVSFQGRVGDVVWDAKTKRILLELTSSSNGKTYDLRGYY